MNYFFLVISMKWSEKHWPESNVWKQATKMYWCHYWWGHEIWWIYSKKMQESRKKTLCTWFNKIFKTRTSKESYENIYRIPDCILPFVWIFCNKIWNNRINNLQEQVLRVVYNDHSSTFEELLVKDIEATLHWCSYKKVFWEYVQI